jgi:nucleotide-binding universal stress UspA family protein
MSEPIVVGYDGTDGSKAALDEALRLAAALDAEVVLAFAYWATPLGGENADLLAALRERGQQILDEAIATARAAGVPARAEMDYAMPDVLLKDTAEAVGAQMIVVGSYGERPLRALLLGSTPHKLLHLTDVPVLVVRGEQARGR